MVQGLPAVKWTPENNAKLLAAIVCLHPGALDPKKLALVFGANVPTSAITYRLGTLRKEGAALGLASNGGSQVASKPIKRAAAGGNKAIKPRKRRGGMLSDAPSDDESTDLKDDTDAEQEATPPDTDSCDAVPKSPNASSKLQSTISGRITKKRASPRKSAKKDYKALEDPFVAMSGTADGDGNKIFDTDNSDSEDTYASDADFTNGEAQQASIKMEEAV